MLSNKEAIERLQMILDGDMTLYMMNEKDAKAVHHAIKALEERPKGKWELFEKRPCENLYMCSNCGHLIESMPDRLAENFKGCYCGARMESDV